MNKYFTGLVAVAAVTTMGATSVPASAQTIDEVKAAIEQVLATFTVTNNTTFNDVQSSYKNEISDFDGTTNGYVNILKRATATTPGAAQINVYIYNNSTTTPGSVAISVDKEIATLTQAEALEDTKISLAQAKYMVVNFLGGGYKGPFPSLQNTKGLDTAVRVSSEPTEEQILEMLNNGVLYSLGVTASFREFKVTPATTTSSGNIYYAVTLTKNGNTAEVRYKKYIDKLPNENQTVAELAAVIKEEIKDLYIDNYENSNEILSELEYNFVENLKLLLSLNDLEITNSTLETEGKATGTIVITDGVNTQRVPFSVPIEKELSDSDIDLQNQCEQILWQFQTLNSTTGAQIKAAVQDGLLDKTVTVSVSKLELDPAAIDDGEGYLYYKITLTRTDGSVVTVDNDLYIYPLSCNDTAPTSSSHHKSSGSTSTTSTDTTGATTTTGTTTTTQTEIPGNTAIPGISLGQLLPGAVTRDVAKAIQAQVVTNLTKALGEGTVAGQAAELVIADGTKVSVTPLTKDGKGLGSVITADTASLQAVIPVNKDADPILAVYKFVPAIGKYILVPNAVITADAITLPVQANATYITSPVVMSQTETIAQGWAQAADSSWFMLNASGDPLTGWQKDSTGLWSSYMSEATGVMQTGWTEVGGAKYFLGNDGYMVTGWIQDGATWRYCNPDGSMATNTMIDGYEVDSTGAWVRR